MSKDRWDRKLASGNYRWKNRASFDEVVPRCESHEFGRWKEFSGFFCGRGGGFERWQSARCMKCGRIGNRDVEIAPGGERQLGQITVTDQGAVTQGMVADLRKHLLEEAARS